MIDYIEKLLKGQPVEWKTLGEVGTFVRGSGLPKKDFTESGIGCIHYGQIYTKYGLCADRTLSFCSEETARKLVRVQKGDLIIACTSENVEDVCKAVTWLGEDEIVTGGHTYVYKHKQNAKFIAYYFTTEAFSREKRKCAQGTKVIDCKASDLARISIPIPPLHVQEEIVAAYEQPSKYIVQSGVNKNDGSTPILTPGKTFVLGYTDEVDGVYLASQAPVILFDDFTSAFKWVDFDFKVKSSAVKMITATDERLVMLRYIYYWMQTTSSTLVDGDHKRQWISSFSKKRIPIPPLSDQARIVAILDKFDTLTTSLTEGLPQELELRRKQYEYYREQLLSFPA